MKKQNTNRRNSSFYQAVTPAGRSSPVNQSWTKAKTKPHLPGGKTLFLYLYKTTEERVSNESFLVLRPSSSARIKSVTPFSEDGIFPGQFCLTSKHNPITNHYCSVAMLMTAAPIVSSHTEGPELIILALDSSSPDVSGDLNHAHWVTWFFKMRSPHKTRASSP